jgi:hypothetical protein
MVSSNLRMAAIVQGVVRRFQEGSVQRHGIGISWTWIRMNFGGRLADSDQPCDRSPARNLYNSKSRSATGYNG